MKDPFQLVRFIEAQSRVYPQALDELEAGEKRTHWMWFIFPQIEGLGSSPTARYFALSGLAEAQAYLAHPVLGARLLECTRTVLALETGVSARALFSTPDDLKFCSSMTLFSFAAQAAGEDATLFQQALKRFFAGKPDPRTLDRLRPELGRQGTTAAAAGGRERPYPHEGTTDGK
jgi:uncharacterized protein (DUF1810 family)